MVDFNDARGYIEDFKHEGGGSNPPEVNYSI